MMKVFHWFCREDLCEAIEGDLLVSYAERRTRMSTVQANFLYFLSVLTFFQPFAVRKNRLNPFANSTNMFINHFKIGFRVMRRHLTYSSINIIGLAIGLSAVILIALFIKDELSYDRFHTKGENIVRVSYQLETPNTTRRAAKLPFPIKDVLLSEYPEVINVARFYNWGGDTPLLEYGSHKYTEEGIYFAETDVFKVFDFEFVSGNPTTALKDPRSIILTEKIVKKYFGTEDPMGKVMRYKNEDDLIVTAVMKDIPDNSHIVFDVLLPIELQRQRWMGWGKDSYDLEKDWNWAAAWVYAYLSSETNIPTFEKKIQAIADTYINTEDQQGFTLEVQPLYDIHLKSDKSSEARANGNMAQIYGFGAVALLILFIACINFINLTSAQANERLKELGLRKIMGAEKHQLIAQFLTESFILISIAALVAIIISWSTLPFFNEFMNKKLVINFSDVPFIATSIGLVLLIAMLSILKPSLSVIRINTVQKFDLNKSKQRFNRMMIIGQFVVCNLLFIGILVVSDQLDYLRNKDLGFDKEEMLILRHGRNLSKDQFEIFENKLAAIPTVKDMHRGYIAGTSAYTNTFKVVGSEDEDTYSLGIKWVGDGFTDMFNLEVIEGRNLDRNISSDVKSSVLINSSAAKALGWTHKESIGKTLSFLPGGADEPEKIKVVGILADANFESLYDPILPSVFRMSENSVGSEVCIKLAGTDNLLKTLGQIESAWDLVIPDWPFEFTFLDDKIQEQYVKEERLASATRYFTLLAIFIACSGLFGLASFAVQQRTKEIGVRKVLGASIQSIFLLISKRFLLLIGISFTLSIPAGYFLANQWLQDFAYRINISPIIFVVSGMVSLAMVLIAVGSQSLKAANSDPVSTLRYE
ncbi:ABC transporter permease [Ekhidna sp.]|uniref:ABC transporter permease n=1 Tax=Ekhidna sp. TaxID=2608089 RepID=UPI003BACCA92